MELTFIGGADGVTGSASLLTDTRLGLRALVDCGAHAERELMRPDGAPRLGFPARALTCVFLTHAHRDHCGRLPQLHRAGFRGPVYCTEATAVMTRIALMDAAKFSREYDADDVEMIDFQALDRRADFKFGQPMRLHGVAVTFGNPPEKQRSLKVEYSRHLTRGHSCEDIPIYRQPNPGDLEAGRGRHTGIAAVP
jgi:metallo-beta-lactamase family protein